MKLIFEGSSPFQVEIDHLKHLHGQTVKEKQEHLQTLLSENDGLKRQVEGLEDKVQALGKRADELKKGTDLLSEKSPPEALSFSSAAAVASSSSSPRVVVPQLDMSTVLHDRAGVEKMVRI